jgi:hypothetical protein
MKQTKLKNSVSFSQKNPHLISEWHLSKNLPHSPESITYGTNLKFWWICPSCSNEYEMSAKERSHGKRCTPCSRKDSTEKMRKSKLKKSGTLAEKFPSLISEWDYKKNKITPNDVSPYSNKKVHWICKFNHKWEVSVDNRTSHKSGCPECNPMSSKLEIYLLCEIRTLFPSTKWRYKIAGSECDIFIPDIKIGIEVDGGYWHKDKLIKDKNKNNHFKKHSVTTVRVRDETLPKINSNHIIYNQKESLQNVANNLIKYLSKFNDIFNFYPYTQQANNEFKEMWARLPAPPEGETLVDKFPDIAEQWDYKRNSPLVPNLFSAGSDQKFYWLCEYGHSFNATIKNRTLRKSGCPKCYTENRFHTARERSIKKNGSLESIKPKYFKMFDFDKNKLSPSKVPIKNKVMIWWMCKNGHSFEKSALNMFNNSKCDECNSFGFNHSDLLKEVSPTRNDMNKVSQLSQFSGKVIWWRCINGHEWETKLHSRTRARTGCPICNDTENLLSRKFPEYQKVWDFNKNNKLKFSEIPYNSNIKAWWICLECNESYSQTVYRKTKNRGCPKCGKKRAVEAARIARLKKYGSLKKNYPTITSYLNKEKNIDLDPDGIASKAKNVVNWKCPKGHEWVAGINTMTDERRSYVCPVCKNKK